MCARVERRLVWKEWVSGRPRAGRMEVLLSLGGRIAALGVRKPLCDFEKVINLSGPWFCFLLF
jgi:hypothetical protein